MGVELRRFKYDTNRYLEKCNPMRLTFLSSLHIFTLWRVDRIPHEGWIK